MRRRNFIKYSSLSLTGVLAIPNFTYSQSDIIANQVKLSIIKEFVIAGHNNLDKVKELITETPNLIYSRYDWGNGDFEEAIEGAGHVGNKEISNYLIEKGARVNLFVLTMLGKTEIVKSTLEEFPSLLFSKGPHGFSLLHHATVGGKDSLELQEYFLEKGLKKENFNI